MENREQVVDGLIVVRSKTTRNRVNKYCDETRGDVSNHGDEKIIFSGRETTDSHVEKKRKEKGRERGESFDGNFA